MQKILILTNNSLGLYRFRKELLMELINPGTFLEDNKIKNDVYVSVPKDLCFDELKEIGCNLIEAELERRNTNPIKDFQLLKYYIKLIKDIKPDIVLTYTIKPNIYGGMACKYLKVPYIANITGLGDAIEQGGILSKILLNLYKFSLSSAKQVFFQNSYNLNFFKNLNIIKNNYTLLPGSGINLEEYKFQEYLENNNKIKFLFVGRILKDKGINELLDCAEFIKYKYSNIEFNIIGRYDNISFKDRIESLNKSGIVNYFEERDNIKDLYKECNAVIMPTYHEGMSNVLLEASASGRPVIASKIPGCKEIFEDGVTGFGFEPKDSQSLIKAVEKFIQLSYEDKIQMGLKAREKVQKEFDRKIVIREYIKNINEVN